VEAKNDVVDGDGGHKILLSVLEKLCYWDFFIHKAKDK
jgi:hypothetical protein